jgi:hypothetical protein
MAKHILHWVEDPNRISKGLLNGQEYDILTPAKAGCFHYGKN